MASLDELLTSLFGSLGPVGSLVILVIIFALDAALFPALPEVWIVVTYTYRPTEMLGPVAWAGLLLAMAVAGDILGTSLLYLAVRRWVVQRRRMPRWLERAMKKWTGFLLGQDERVVLMKRVVPVIPMEDRPEIAIRPESAHRRFHDEGQEDKASDRTGPDCEIVGLVQDQILPDPAERLERRPPEEKAVTCVVRDAPDRHRPLVRVRKVEQRSLDPSSVRLSETRGAADDVWVGESKEDGLEEIPWQDAFC